MIGQEECKGHSSFQRNYRQGGGESQGQNTSGEELG